LDCCFILCRKTAHMWKNRPHISVEPLNYHILGQRQEEFQTLEASSNWRLPLLSIPIENRWSSSCLQNWPCIDPDRKSLC
jgi:hypothetical protein